MRVNDPSVALTAEDLQMLISLICEERAPSSREASRTDVRRQVCPSGISRIASSGCA